MIAILCNPLFLVYWKIPQIQYPVPYINLYNRLSRVGSGLVGCVRIQHLGNSELIIVIDRFDCSGFGSDHPNILRCSSLIDLIALLKFLIRISPRTVFAYCWIDLRSTTLFDGSESLLRNGVLLGYLQWTDLQQDSNLLWFRFLVADMKSAPENLLYGGELVGSAEETYTPSF